MAAAQAERAPNLSRHEHSRGHTLKLEGNLTVAEED
jgi:hypothetical protein